MGAGSMTALVSAFVRAYHFQNEWVRVFEDSVAKQLLGEDYERDAKSMAAGVGWFELGFPAHRKKRSGISSTDGWPRRRWRGRCGRRSAAAQGSM